MHYHTQRTLTAAPAPQAADFLQADAAPWAARFCKALVRDSPHAERAWELLTADDEHIFAIVLSAHPLLSDRSVPLGLQLQQLPQCMHVHACRAALSVSAHAADADAAAPALSVNAHGCVETLQLLAEALPDLPEVRDLQISDFGTSSTLAWPPVAAAIAAAPRLARVALAHGALPDEAIAPLGDALAAQPDLRLPCHLELRPPHRPRAPARAAAARALEARVARAALQRAAQRGRGRARPSPARGSYLARPL